MIDNEGVRKSFRSDGYVVVRSLIPRQEISIAGKLVRRVIARFRSGEHIINRAGISIGDFTRIFPDDNPKINPAEWDHEPYIIRNLLSFEPLLARLFAFESIWYCASYLLDREPEDLLFHFSNLTRKSAQSGPGVRWHRDFKNTYFANESGVFLRVLIPLNSMSHINGGTTFIRGSHTRLDNSLVDSYCPDVKPGDCLIIHSKTLHGGAPNRSKFDRDLIVLQFGLKESRLRYKANELMSLSNQEQMSKFSEGVSRVSNFRLIKQVED
ncbi:phytanoyl-CoA dioxygenase family protein [Pseudomonas sp. CCNWLW23]|uniref:phytanoyl-CoA dioxygenase family protein n=1 Tax=Pseudomonas sp. CCNWLW23 TaxID=3126385 RepID=UPI003012FB30